VKILDRYIIQKYLTAFVFVVFILVAIILVIDLTENVDKYNNAGVSTWQVITYYLDYIPWIANMITPVTTFIAVVFITSKMAGHTEIIAMLSSGVSFPRLLYPYFIGSVIVAVVSFFLTGWVIPISNEDRLEFQMEYMDKENAYFNERNIHIQSGPNTYLYMQSYNNQSNVGYRFTAERFDTTKQMRIRVSANQISWMQEEAKWKLKNWVLREFNGQEEFVKVGEELDTTLIIHPDEFQGNSRMFEAMTLPELTAYIDTLEERGADGREMYLVEKYVRYTAPFTVIILTFIGVVVSSRKTRGGTGFQIALGFTLSFVYILFFILVKSIAEAGSLNPLFAVWMPNIVFIGIGLLMYRYVPR
jgi:lipopolysaccharide export system permease protein